MLPDEAPQVAHSRVSELLLRVSAIKGMLNVLDVPFIQLLLALNTWLYLLLFFGSVS